jgi:hypothetical protein
VGGKIKRGRLWSNVLPVRSFWTSKKKKKGRREKGEGRKREKKGYEGPKTKSNHQQTERCRSQHNTSIGFFCLFLKTLKCYVQENVTNGIKHDDNVGGICGTRHVGVDGFFFVFIEFQEFVPHVGRGRLEGLLSCAVCERRRAKSAEGMRNSGRQERRAIPRYSGKQIVSGTLLIFSSKISFLFKNMMNGVFKNHLVLHSSLKSCRDSCILFVSLSS